MTCEEMREVSRTCFFQTPAKLWQALKHLRACQFCEEYLSAETAKEKASRSKEENDAMEAVGNAMGDCMRELLREKKL